METVNAIFKNPLVRVILLLTELVVVFVPIIMYFSGSTKFMPQFVLAIIGMLPLAKRVGDSVEQLCDNYCSRRLGGFLAATLGNAPELIFGVVAVYQNQVALMSAAMFGSPMSNILLVLGSAIVAGTYFKGKGLVVFQNKSIHCLGSTLTLISSMSYALLPIVIALYGPGNTPQSASVGFSEVVSVCNFVIYCLFTYYKLNLEEVASAGKSRATSVVNKQSVGIEVQPNPNNLIPFAVVVKQEEVWSLWYILAMMTGVTVIITLLSIVITGSVDYVLVGSPLSKTFVGIIILPFICNAAEHVTAIFSMLSDDEDAADGAMEIAGGSALQILGFVVPVINFLSFGAPTTFTFNVDPLILITLNATTLIMRIVTNDNTLHEFEGLGMVLAWVMIGASFYIYKAVLA